MENQNKVNNAITYNQKNDIAKSYADDVSFMEEYIKVIQLTDASNNAKVAISAALQGRIMTSSANGDKGRSYGWINKELFKSKDTLEHINVFGGEERFWLGPEGGQYSIFFKKGTEFTLEDWYTPKLIDLEPFDIKNQTSNKVIFTKTASLKNYSGFQFDLGIEREVSMLSKNDIQKELGLVNLPDELKTVAYQTKNTLTNVGKVDWKKETGLLSIWMLGMYNHSPNTTIIVPYIQGDEAELGAIVNDAYFGKVPSDRLMVKEGVIYFKGDGEYRSKIGLSQQRAKDIVGSYDSKNGVLTILKYNKPENTTDYVNSMWEIQEEPFKGDVVNAYNDGAPSPGEKPLGPFYELESSSPAMDLKSGESGTHIQITFHIEGDEATLNSIIKQLFGTTTDEIKSALK
ncbi:hypothetical protein OAJ14_07155 [Polaribacter sp.]|nr:hypothetical protein [Polaribacter sp.]